MSNVFIAFQKNEDSRAIVNDQPAMVKIAVPGRMVIRKSTIAEEIGRDFDLQEMHVHLITLSGNIDETDDEFSLTWNQ